MHYSETFTIDINRVGTNSVKWDLEASGDSSAFASSIADLDFAVTPEVVNALMKRMGHPTFGYTFVGDEAYEAVAEWYRNLHGLHLTRENIILLPFGPRAALQFIARTMIRRDDIILVPSPTYPGLLRLGMSSNATLIEWPMVFSRDKYRLNLDWLRTNTAFLKPTILALCNPNNPLGAVVDRSDLSAALEIISGESGSIRLLLSDEVHGDLIHPPGIHHSALLVENSIETVVLSSVGKTFNLSGLSTSYLITRSSTLSTELKRYLDTEGFYEGSLFGCIAQTAALKEGRPWRDKLVVHLAESASTLNQMLLTSHSGLSAIIPEASFLLWVDYRRTGLTEAEIIEALRDARVSIQPGSRFGIGGEGFIRFNFGCSIPRAMAGMQSIIDVVQKIRSG